MKWKRTRKSSSELGRYAWLLEPHFFTMMRINYAIERLKDPHASILDIAMESGFNNPASFNRAFRKITGRSPRELRGDEHF